ncbi:MAG: hypothetical protein ACXWUG_28230, partial [Polyangiales bacterium]
VFKKGLQIGVTHDDAIFGSKGETLAVVDAKGHVTFSWDPKLKGVFTPDDVLVITNADFQKQTCAVGDDGHLVEQIGNLTPIRIATVEGVPKSSRRLLCLAEEVLDEGIYRKKSD